MNLIYNFMLKDIKELQRSRKIFFISLIILLLYPVIVNVLAERPLIPLHFVIIILSMLLAGFSGEILYYSTINEIKYRIFDVFLVSKIDNLHLLLSKILLPVLVSFPLALISLVINNTVVSLFPHYELVSVVLHFETIIIFISAAITSSLVEFGALMIIGNKINTQIHTSIMAISYLLLISMYIANVIFGVFIFIIIAITVISLLVFLDCYLINLYRVTNLVRKSSNTQSILPDKNISFLSAFLRKEIIVSGFNFFTVIRLIFSSMFPIAILSFIINDIELLRVFFRIALYFVCNFGVLNILFPVAKIEQINRYADVFQVARISEFKLYFLKCILPFFTMSVGFFLSFLLTWIYCTKTGSVFLFDWVALVIAILSTCCSAFVTLWFSRFIYSYKDARIVGFFISIMTFTFHIIISFIPYWFL